jgi:hypothetical protein
MKLRSILAAVGIAFLLYLIYLVAAMWLRVPVPGYEVRRNRFTGIVQVRDGDRWNHFRPDPYSASLTAEDFKRLRITDAAWGPGGILCGRAENISDQPVTGRVSFRIVIREARGQGKFLRDRSLRESVDFPPKRVTPFVLRTNLTTPDPAETRTDINLEPTATTGE